MTIERTCKITLTHRDICEALNTHIRNRAPYDAAIKSWEECLVYELQRDGSVLVTWGARPEPDEPDTDSPVAADPAKLTREDVDTLV